MHHTTSIMALTLSLSSKSLSLSHTHFLSPILPHPHTLISKPPSLFLISKSLSSAFRISLTLVSSPSISHAHSHSLLISKSLTPTHSLPRNLRRSSWFGSRRGTDASPSPSLPYIPSRPSSPNVSIQESRFFGLIRPGQDTAARSLFL